MAEGGSAVIAELALQAGMQAEVALLTDMLSVVLAEVLTGVLAVFLQMGCCDVMGECCL